jgi:hypothetical protein
VKKSKPSAPLKGKGKPVEFPPFNSPAGVRLREQLEKKGNP